MVSLENRLGELGREEMYRRRIMHDYNADFFRKSVRFVDKRRFWLFGKSIPRLFFDEIVIAGEENVREVGGEQLMYVSNHTSMADFLVQGYVFGRCNLPIPRIVAGANLNKWPLGRLFKKLGAIYVDRNVSRGNKNYWKVYDTCIKEVLGNKEGLLNYAEGTRTDGEFVERFKTGTFKQVLEYVKKGGDVWIVPAYINYDKRIDSRFIGAARKYRGKRDRALEKKQFWRARLYDWTYYGLDFVSFIVRVFSKDKGNAYLYVRNALRKPHSSECG